MFKRMTHGDLSGSNPMLGVSELDAQAELTFQTPPFSELTKDYEASLLKVFNTAQVHSYATGWKPPVHGNGSGSAFLLTYRGENFIVTNAHVASDSIFLKVRLSNESKEYMAEVVTIDHDCDLAILEITKDASTFWDKVTPLELGDMFLMGQKVNVCGFPIGGDGLCITEGKISRIEVGNYVQGAAYLLQGQITAQINPGNSGGPALSDGKVIGVAFQGNSQGEGLGYIIPPDVIRHFLDDYLAPGPYKGFPNLAFNHQRIISELQKKHYGLGPDEAGIRVNTISKFSSSNGMLKVNDVIYEVDGHPLASDGTVELSFSKRIAFKHLITMKHIGEPVQLKVIRKTTDGSFEKLTLDITLHNRSGVTQLVAPLEHGQPGPFFIASGIAFVPLTANYLMSAGPSIKNGLGTLKYLNRLKSKLGEQVILISYAFPSEYINGYNGLSQVVVKSVNGIKIDNMRQLAMAFDSNSLDYHEIETEGEDKIVFPRLTRTQELELLSRFGVSQDRSIHFEPETLSEEISYAPGVPERWMKDMDLAPKPAMLTQFEADKKSSPANDPESKTQEPTQDKSAVPAPRL